VSYAVIVELVVVSKQALRDKHVLNKEVSLTQLRIRDRSAICGATKVEPLLTQLGNDWQF